MWVDYVIFIILAIYVLSAGGLVVTLSIFSSRLSAAEREAADK